MEFNKNNSQSVKNQATSLGLHQEKKDGIRSFVKKALDTQVFFNSRKMAFEYIEKQGNVSTAMLTLNIEKIKGFLGMNCKLRFSLLHSTANGQVFQTKNFYTVEIPAKEGMTPDYILKALASEDNLEIKFNLDDLSALYDERSINVDEEATFSEITELCNKEGVAKILLIDRVFYTRILCYNSTNEPVGAIHVGALREVPNDLSNVLYPGGQIEYTL